MNDQTKQVKVPLTRDQIRAKVFSKIKPRIIDINVFGVDIELHQPTLKAILEAQDTEDTGTRMAQMIINYAYVPGTTTRVFDEADAPMILTWPFGDDLIRLQKAITLLTGVDVTGAEKEVTESPLKELS